MFLEQANEMIFADTRDFAQIVQGDGKGKMGFAGRKPKG
jgi:hypothetical protein